MLTGGLILEPHLILLAVVAVIGLVVVMAAASGRFGPPRAAGALGRTRGVVDRSLGMFVLRRLAGRSTIAPPIDPSATGPASGEDAGRPASSSGPVVPIRARTEVYGVPMSPRPVASRAMPVTAGRRLPRQQLARDAGVALAGLAAVALVAVALWPGAVPPTGGVLGITRGTATEQPSTHLPPAGSSSAAEPSGLTDPAASPPTLEPPSTSKASVAPVTEAAALTPRPPPTAMPPRTPTPTTRPTSKPSATPGPTPVPTSTSTPTPTPEPTPTPLPSPVAAFSCTAGGLTLTCDGTASTDAAGYGWTFDDGGTASAAQPSHAYAAAGTYTVGLTVTNATGSDTRTQVFTLG